MLWLSGGDGGLVGCEALHEKDHKTVVELLGWPPAIEKSNIRLVEKLRTEEPQGTPGTIGHTIGARSRRLQASEELLNVTQPLEPAHTNVSGHLLDEADDLLEEVGGWHRVGGSKDRAPVVGQKLRCDLRIRMWTPRGVLDSLELELLATLAPQAPETQQLVDVLLPIHELVRVEIAELHNRIIDG